MSAVDERNVDETPANDLVMTKYATAGDIANSVLKEVLAEVKEGAEVGALCDLGDKLILERTSKIYKKEKDVLKGIAMPTCVSINNCVCHFSPLKSDPPVILRKGQMVKIDLGAHIDGYIGTAAHTVVVGATADDPVVDNQANVILAAYNAMETAIRMLRPGLYKNMEITDMIDKIAAIYKVKPAENMLSHELKRHKIDGEKQVIQNPGEKQRAEFPECFFDRYEVYAIDILMSTGEGKIKNLDTRVTVYKKTDDLGYSLKMKAARVFFSYVVNNFGSMPFTLRSFENEKQAKFGVVECERHSLLQAYQVYYEKENEYVAHFKSTVLVMPNGLLKIAGLPLDAACIKSVIQITDEKVLSILNSSLKPRKHKKKANEVKKMEKDKHTIAADIRKEDDLSSNESNSSSEIILQTSEKKDVRESEKDDCDAEEIDS